MAKEYVVKVFGKKTKYRKVGSKYFRIKKDGTLAKDSATGLILANLKNAAGSSIVTTPKKVATSMLATVKSAVSSSKKNKRGQAQASTSTTKDDGGKAVKDFKRDIGFAKDGGKSALDKAAPNRNVALKKKALNIIKKDANNTKTDSKPVIKKKVEKKVEKKKDVKPLQKTQSKAIKSTTTKALQNKPKQEVKKKVEKKITKKPESRLDSKGNYKGTNIKPTKLQLDRLKKRGLA